MRLMRAIARKMKPSPMMMKERYCPRVTEPHIGASGSLKHSAVMRAAAYMKQKSAAKMPRGALRHTSLSPMSTRNMMSPSPTASNSWEG